MDIAPLALLSVAGVNKMSSIIGGRYHLMSLPTQAARRHRPKARPDVVAHAGVDMAAPQICHTGYRTAASSRDSRLVGRLACVNIASNHCYGAAAVGIISNKYTMAYIAITSTDRIVSLGECCMRVERRPVSIVIETRREQSTYLASHIE